MSLEDSLRILRCPACRGELARGEGELRCARCAGLYPVEDGIPFFCETSYRFPVGPQPDVKAIVEAAGRGEGAREVRARFSGCGLAPWFLDGSRADGVLLAPFHPERTVALEVGAGFGGVAIPLSRLVARVWAVDPSADGIRFLAARARAEGLRNLRAATADALALPFADGSFDLVVMNGCLEWIPLSRPALAPEQAQAAALSEAARVLADGGHLYLAIENRFGARYLLGARDEHTGLRWVTALPRPLASLLSRAARGRPYREHTQSAGRLALLVRQAGLALAGTYAPLRDYRVFRFLVDCDTPKALSLLVGRSMPFRTRTSRIFLRSARIGLALRLPGAGSPTVRTALYPSIALVARKGLGAGSEEAGDQGWIEMAAREDFGAGVGRHRLVVSSGRSATVFVFASGSREPVGVVKVQRAPGERDWVRNEHEFLDLLARLPDREVAFSVPHPVRLRQAGGMTIATQEFASGRPLGAIREGAPAAIDEVRRWLVALGRATARPAGAASLEELLAPVLDRIEAQVRPREARVRRRWEDVRRTARALAAPPLVACHFDLDPSNVLRTPGGLRVVDWEYARWHWAPYDWFRFLCRYALAAAGTQPDLSRPIERDGPLLRALRRGFHRPGPLSRCFREQSLSFLGASGFPPEAASAVFTIASLEYLLAQVPLRRTDRLVSLLLADRDVFRGVGP